ncbi:similar to Saccharomyces cerevisiae YCR073C SSK22 MAP kinase kinase kinase of the HOG1 mitogen-activated signaling pathway [Maudiozyma barnettii]|mgnify:CR=1 FL=1|uniref:Similar to Saccharomyces cerevisiae YCR073C SSK22 MAP kinase kinase kinase of the HOG1 mitogen-activated signaling pathway n=1 Tax=Maudiozyma barnettii TaxID=61262 RepID=A0A8H2VFX1_9SACH|nr:mitogen-activated protein kinase kinase kinase SSK22 [Kazachstania barnettii]CAB4254772.1 similar to Saccharomyces cerevisiae YCR073C SSK22 MAP kinase kinase kinase of the HOG1 mitogen-activated signaling pathway [Kazachstania barnettii]CAD1782907.1 similar to Saccharomyces cerevisiae YCR073C SSK22 MAP kinase kinase kinase of the HOG1 mitogen-activated signaling pathway [Kazachstania barnettii]
MPEPDYFNYKSDSSPSSHQNKLNKHFKLDTNVSLAPQKDSPIPLSPGSKALNVPNSASLTNALSINQFIAPALNNVSLMRQQGKRKSSKSGLSYQSSSNNSSAHSSRRPSAGNATNFLNKLTSPAKVNMKVETSDQIQPQKRTLAHGSNSESNASTPTLVLPPDLASLNTKKSSTMLHSPQVPNTVHRSPSMHDTNGTIHIMTGTPPQETLSSTSSTRSVTLAQTSTGNLRAFKKQYVLNEKLYLEKMNNALHSDDYYTRKIGLSSLNDDYDDFDIDIDDPFSEHGSSSGKVGSDEIDFGTTFSTSNSLSNKGNIVSITPRYLFHQLQWVKKSNPEETQLISLLGKIQKTEYKYLIKQQKLLDRRPEEPSAGSTSLEDTSVDAIHNTEHNYMEELSNFPIISERMNWQTMLSNVLKGDIVMSEKSKIAEQIKNPALKNQVSDDIWYELKGWMNGKSKDEIVKSVKLLRDSADEVFEEVLTFRIDEKMEHDTKQIQDSLEQITNKYYRTIDYWPSLKQMKKDKPITRNENFINRIAVFNSWLNIKQNSDIKIQQLKDWVGNEDLDVIKQATTPMSTSTPSLYAHSTRSFAEQVMKEKDIENIFEKRIFSPLAPWLAKSKSVLIQYEDTLDIVNIQFDGRVLSKLLLFPMKLVKEIINTRLSYAKKLKNPTMMMIDQMIEDFSSYIRLSVQIKCALVEYCDGMPINIDIDPDFDKTVLDAISYLFTLLHSKVLDERKASLRTFREPEILLKYWDELKNVGQYIDKAGKLIANEFNKLTLRILHKLHAYLLQQQDHPPKFHNSAEAEKWLVEVFENLGSMKRKLNRFTNVLTRAFQNSVNYEIDNYKDLLSNLKESGHFLIYTGGSLEVNGVYLIGSPELLGCQDEQILRILNNSDIGSDLIPKLEKDTSLASYNNVEDYFETYALSPSRSHKQQYSYQQYNGYEDIIGSMSGSRGGVTNKNTNENDSDWDHANVSGVHSSTAITHDYNDVEKEMLELELKLHSLGYILVLCPAHPILWEGDMYNLSSENPLQYEMFKLKFKTNKLTLLNQGSSYALEYQTDKFQQIAQDTISFIERRCSFSSIESNLQRINKAYFRFTYNVLNNYTKFYNTFKKICTNLESLNNIFLFTRDFGTYFLKVNIANFEKKSVIILLMVRLSIRWLTFITDECDPTDQKTFRWCVPAMEFAMHMTSGHNIMALDENQFITLKQKIAACMSLLISHFDVMGARAVEDEKMNPQQRINISIHEDFDGDATLALNSELRLEAIKRLESSTTSNSRLIGKVLDDADKGNKYLLSLASSLSNVSIRWQKRDFVGGGTFGKVYSAINLDNGDILAVKEIKIQDGKAMKKVFPSIKEEMEVLEMLNHPNIVQYYGVEVHREKVNIFMEYCEGGSLASLLEHGRIEDEMVTQVYTLELLEGLAYLHQSGVVHRDIKPENILLDFNGVIKYVDFGAAKKIARNGTMMGRFSISNSSDSSNSTTSGNGKKSQENTREEIPTGLQEMMGTPMYMAPESITGSSNKGKFGADDVWSLGCVVLEMITGRRPWSNLDNEWAIMYHVAAGHIPQQPAPDEVSASGRLFLSKCLVQNPTKRATAVELLVDPWIVEIRELAFGPGEDTQTTLSIPPEKEPNTKLATETE